MSKKSARKSENANSSAATNPNSASVNALKLNSPTRLKSGDWKTSSGHFAYPGPSAGATSTM